MAAAALHETGLHPSSKGGPEFPFSSIHLPSTAPPTLLPLSNGPVWDATVPFSFRKRTAPLEFNLLLNVDLERIVRERDIASLQRHIQQLTFGDIRPDDVLWFTGTGDGDTGAANAIHLFRMCQLSMEALLHVQSFLLKSLQAKEGAVASNLARYESKMEKDAATIAMLKAQLAEAKKAGRKKDAVIAGYERAGARIQPVTYLPANSAAKGSGTHQAVYPGEVYTCALCAGAFVSPQYLTQHYARRHPGFVHPAQEVAARPPPPPQAAPQQQQPIIISSNSGGITSQELDRQLRDMRRDLEAQFASQAITTRRLEQEALLARLNTLESIMREQFASQTIPASMLAQQQQIYQSLIDEIEQIKRDIARGHNTGHRPGQPQWHVKPQTPTKKPEEESSMKRQYSHEEAKEEDLHRPAPLAVLSPANSAASAATSPIKYIEPSPLAKDLNASDRLRAVLLRRMDRIHSVFPELPMVKSRYATEEWHPSSPMGEYRELEAILEQLSQPENQDQLVVIEHEMHAQSTAKDSYNEIHSSVEALSSSMPPEESLIAADESLGRRWTFLQTWARLIEAKEERQRARDAERERTEHEEFLRRRQAETAASQQDLLRQKELEEKTLEADRLLEEKSKQLEKAQQEMMARLEAHRSSQSSSTAASPTSTTTAETLQQEQSVFDRMPSQQRTDFGRPLEEVPDFSRSTAEKLQPQHGIFSPSNQAPEGLQIYSPASYLRADPLASSRSTSQSADTPMSNLTVLPSRLPQPASSHRPEGIAGAPTPLHLNVTTPANGRSIMTERGTGREGWDQSRGTAQTPLQSVMPRTPSVLGTVAKTPLSVFTPSMRQKQRESEVANTTQQQQQPQPLIPLQLGGAYSPSSSLNSSSGASSFSAGASGAHHQPFSHSYGGASIMARSTGGLAHISEGGSGVDESGVSTNTTMLNANTASGQPLNRSRRNSAEQEGKYNSDSEPPQSSPARHRMVIPRTEVDDQFEEMISPKRVQPREKPSIVLAPTPQAGVNETSRQFMVSSFGASTNTTQPAASPMQQPLGSTTNRGTYAQLPISSVPTPSSTVSSVTLPPPTQRLVGGRQMFGSAATPSAAQGGPAAGSLGDRGVSQPGAVSQYANQQIGAATPGPGYTPHTYAVGGHSFTFSSNTPAAQPSSASQAPFQSYSNPNMSASSALPPPHSSSSQYSRALLSPSSVPEESAAPSPTATAAAGAAAGGGEFDDSDEFPMSSDAQEHLDESRAAQAQAAQQEEDMRKREARREELEALGLPATTTTTAASQPQPTAVASSTYRPSASLNDSVEETITLSSSMRQPSNIASSERVTFTAAEPQRRDQAFLQRPAGGVESLISPSSVMSQPGREEVSPAVPVVAAAAASGVPARPAARPDMQAFAPSPAASFTASNAVAPFTSSPSVNAVQPFIASPDPAPASFQRPVHSTAAGISQPTFLSEFPDEFDGGEDEPARSSATVAVAAPAPAAWTSAAAAPAASTASSSAKAPWMTAVRADDDVAVVEDFDDDEEIYGRPQQKQGTAVIAPGSVSNARAALTGAGFFLSPQHAAGHTPSMAALKSARAARMGEDTPTAVAEESESLTSPITSTKASSKPKPAAARRSRTIQSFVLTPKSDL